MPDAEANLLSISKLTKCGFEVSFRGARAFIRQRNRIIGIADLENGLYRIREAEFNKASDTRANEF